MFNHDNIYYFPENIDVRTCPKNASASIRQFFIEVYTTVYPDGKLKEQFYHFDKLKKNGSVVSYRWKQIIEYADFFNLPFRKNSVKFAMKRDPVERFKSCVEMLQARDLAQAELAEIYADTQKRYKFYESVHDLLNDLEDNKLVESHFLKQTYYLGDIKQYDYVYDVKDCVELQKHILKFNNLKWNDKRWYVHTNISDNTEISTVENLRQTIKSNNIKTYTHYGKNKNLITQKMSVKDLYRVKKLYEEDYDNGWC